MKKQKRALINKKHLLSIKKKIPLVFSSPHAKVVGEQSTESRPNGKTSGNGLALLFFPLLDDVRVPLNVPEVVLFARSYRLAPSPLGTLSFNSIAHSHIFCVSLHSVMGKPCVLRQSRSQITLRHDSAIWLVDLAPKRTLPKQCRYLPDSRLGRRLQN